MARTADKPGTYRIRPKGLGWIVSGVKPDGTRIRIPATSEFEAMAFADTVFSGMEKATAPVIPKITDTGTGPLPSFDSWGLPKVTQESADSIASAMGIPPVTPNAPTNPTVAQQDQKIRDAAAKQAEIQANRKKTAKSMAELMGHGYAMGVIMGSQRLVANMGKAPVNPSPKQVSQLAEATKDTIPEWFGDHEVKPWIMMILLSVGIPLSMYIQSPKVVKKLLTEPSPEQSEDAQLHALR